MAIGFSEEYDTSRYDQEEFLNIWPEISEIGKEIVGNLILKVDRGTEYHKGSRNDAVTLVKGALYILGYSTVNEGDDISEYDFYLSDAIVSYRKASSDYIMSISDEDVIDNDLVMSLRKVFEATQEYKIIAIYNFLRRSRSGENRIAALPSTTRYEKRVEIPKPTPISKGEINPGANYPIKNLEWLTNSVKYSLASDGEKKLGKYFTVKEFACNDKSDLILINPSLITLLEKIREHFNKPIRITSGYRTPAYNEKLISLGKKAAVDSQHMYGNAADISIEGVPSKEIYSWLNSFHQGGLGLYSSFVHVDVRDDVGKAKARWIEGEKKKQNIIA